MRSPLPQFRFRAVSMELAAHLDEHHVDMLIVADDGTTISIECEDDTILKIQRYIAQLAKDCPEIALWNTADVPAATASPNATAWAKANFHSRPVSFSPTIQ